MRGKEEKRVISTVTSSPLLLLNNDSNDDSSYVCGSSRLNAYSCLPEWIVVSPSSELSSSEKQGGQDSKHMYTIPG